ncbi:MAG: helix-turn-helix transcriptional regulator [Proteobacteria bacterium]|nr:helix-turn-helix transcriptional regulator [Pseudomonadota bacterium]
MSYVRPGLYGGKDLSGCYLYLSDDFAPLFGYRSLDHFMEHTRTDYDIKAKAVELAPVLIEEDKKVVTNECAIKMVTFACFTNDTWSLMYAEKKPIYKDNKIYGVASSYIEVTEKRMQSFLLNSCEKNYFFENKKKQFSFNFQQNHNEKLFSKRESECLFFVIRGKACSEIASILGIKRRTVEVYVDNLKEKLKVFNKSQLIEKALSLGYYFIIPESIIDII